VCSHYCIKKGKVTFKDTGDQEQARDLEQSDNAHFAQPPQENDLVTGDLVTDGDMPSSSFALVQSLEPDGNAQTPQENDLVTGDLVTDGDMPSSSFALVQSLEPGGNAQTPQENDLVTGDLVTHNGVSSEQFYPVESQVSVDNEQAVQVTNNNTGATLDVNDNSAVGYVLLLVEYFTFGYQQILLHT